MSTYDRKSLVLYIALVAISMEHNKADDIAGLIASILAAAVAITWIVKGTEKG